MLNTNLNSTTIMSDTPLANQSRVDDLMNTILEARKSLQNWEDQKTEALIKLDALTYDIRMIGEEKNRAQESANTEKKELQSEIRVYQHHVENLSDQISLIQMEREGLQNQLSHAQTENQTHLKNLIRLQASELKLQEELKTGMAKIQTETEGRLTAQFERTYGEENQKLKLQVQELIAQNHTLIKQRDEAEARASRSELELNGIRSHMMGVLRVGDGASSSAGVSHPLETRPAEPKTTDVKKLRAVEIESTTVDEYLKRLGY